MWYAQKHVQCTHIKIEEGKKNPNIQSCLHVTSVSGYVECIQRYWICDVNSKLDLNRSHPFYLDFFFCFFFLLPLIHTTNTRDSIFLFFPTKFSTKSLFTVFFNYFIFSSCRMYIDAFKKRIELMVGRNSSRNSPDPNAAIHDMAFYPLCKIQYYI